MPVEGSCCGSTKPSTEAVLLAGCNFTADHGKAEFSIAGTCTSPHELQTRRAPSPHTPHRTGHRLTLVYVLCSWLMKHSSPSERKSCILRLQSRAWPMASPPHLLKGGINAVFLSLLIPLPVRRFAQHHLL